VRSPQNVVTRRLRLVWGFPMNLFRILGCAAIVMCSVVSAPALAQTRTVTARPAPEPIVRPAPAPLIGVGLPMVGGVLAALLLGRRFRRKD
jgi:hypothetical protein